MCELGTATGLDRSSSSLAARVSSRGLASIDLLAGDGSELAGLGWVEGLVFAGRGWRLLGREL